MKTRRFGANSELRCRTRNFPPTAINGRRWTAQLHSNANVSSVSQCLGSKRNMFDLHSMLSTRTTGHSWDGKASAQLVVDQKVTIAPFSSWVANNGRREGSSAALAEDFALIKSA